MGLSREMPTFLRFRVHELCTECLGIYRDCIGFRFSKKLGAPFCFESP